MDALSHKEINMSSQLGSFSLYYDTKETTDHTMDASDLAIGLQGLCETITQADKLLNGEDSQVDIKVNVPNEGSFGIPIEVISYLEDSKNVLEAIGFVAQASIPAGCIFGALEFLKGRKIDAVLEEGKETKIKTRFRGKEEELTVSSDHAKLILNKDFRDSLNKALVAPVKGDTNAVVHIKSFDGKRVVHSIEENKFFSYRTISAKTGTEEEETEELVNVRFINVNFDKATGWQIEHVQESKTVIIRDEGFLRRVRADEDKFSKGNLYTVKLKTIQTKSIDGSSKARYEISQVVKKLGE